MPGGKLGHGLDLLAILGCAIAVRLELVGLIGGQAQATGGSYSPIIEELLQRGHIGFGGQLRIARGLEIDLVHPDLLFHVRPLVVEAGEVGRNGVHFLVTEINGDAQVGVAAGLGRYD